MVQYKKHSDTADIPQNLVFSNPQKMSYLHHETVQTMPLNFFNPEFCIKLLI